MSEFLYIMVIPTLLGAVLGIFLVPVLLFLSIGLVRKLGRYITW